MKILGENGYVSECGGSNFICGEDDESREQIQEVQELESNEVQVSRRKAKKRSNENVSNEDVIKCFKTLRRDILDEMRTIRNSINLVAENRRVDVSPRDRLLIKIPFAENFDEFQLLEDKLSDPGYNKQMVEELSRFKGNCLQSSLSNIIAQLLSKSLLKQFCFKGSKGRNSFEIQKKAFNKTVCYGVINGIYITISSRKKC